MDCWTDLPDPPFFNKYHKAIDSIRCNNEFLIVDLSPEYKGKINESKINQIYKRIEECCEEKTGLNDAFNVKTTRNARFYTSFFEEVCDSRVSVDDAADYALDTVWNEFGNYRNVDTYRIFGSNSYCLN